jgi:prepilin-type N-terminal cleavage/methylation domain-containing protein
VRADVPPISQIVNRKSQIVNPCAFTLIELLVVISIMGLLAALAVPALKNLGKNNIQVSASRQLLDDVGRARQLAISHHTTVYMVFVKTNFWLAPTFNSPWWNPPYGLTFAQKTAATNLCDKQLTGYNFVSLRSVGDQPGQGVPRYLASTWQTLPDGTYIALWKFYQTVYQTTRIIDGSSGQEFDVAGFATTNTLPVPTQDSPTGSSLNISPAVFNFPYIAFNYLGQLTFDGQNLASRDEYIPLAQGTVSPAINATTKAYIINLPPTVSENPPGNSSNTMYNLVHIDRLTGRATLEYQKVQ